MGMTVLLTLKNNESFIMGIYKNVFTDTYEGYLLSSKFPNTYSLGDTIGNCVSCMKIRLYQLIRNEN